jgi:hypothetical protein
MGLAMNAKRILEIVSDMSMWRGDVYKLAYAIAEEQKEVSAIIAEETGHPDTAELIRAS